MLEQRHTNELIAALQLRMEERFDQVESQFREFSERVHDNEMEVSKIKTAGSVFGVLAVFFGWDSIKHWLTFLTK